MFGGLQSSPGPSHVGHATAVARGGGHRTEPAAVDADPAVRLGVGGLHRRMAA
jgi:hypothetical protein